jgi:nucleoside-diphosphate-sugar epimerase
MKVLVTGAEGYIGTSLVPLLLQQNFKVTALDNYHYHSNSMLSTISDENFSLIEGDVRDDDIMKPLIRENDILIPLAGIVGAFKCDKDPKSAEQINRDSIIRLAKQKSKEQLLIFPSTTSIYGPTKEGSLTDEQTLPTPSSLYAKSKAEAEDCLLKNTEAISLRFSTLFGVSPRLRTELLVNNFVYIAYFEKYLTTYESHFKRNFLHVMDASRAFLHAIEYYAKLKGDVFNVGLQNCNLTKKELCSLIQNQIPDFKFDEKSDGHDPDKRNYMIDSSKLREAGFKTTVTLEQGIKELIKHYSMLKTSNEDKI